MQKRSPRSMPCEPRVYCWCSGVLSLCKFAALCRHVSSDSKYLCCRKHPENANSLVQRYMSREILYFVGSRSVENNGLVTGVSMCGHPNYYYHDIYISSMLKEVEDPTSDILLLLLLLPTTTNSYNCYPSLVHASRFHRVIGSAPPSLVDVHRMLLAYSHNQ